MNLNISGTQISPIVSIAQRINQLSIESGKKYLPLNRGINSVCNIDLNGVIPLIDFNSSGVQAYPAALGRGDLKSAINKVYYNGKVNLEHIIITGGSTLGLDIIFQTLSVKKIFLPRYYWTTYNAILTIRGNELLDYTNYDELKNNPDKFKDSAVIICDPGNPVGDKFDDEGLMQIIEQLNRNQTPVILDSPYRRMFFDEADIYYQRLMNMENVIVVESFSKCLGLSGQRIGFVYSANPDFIKEYGLRLISATNGINAFAQVLCEKLLATEPGQEAVKEFKVNTLRDIRLNIQYLENHHILAEQFYRQAKPVGIFVIVNKSEEELLQHRIGSISLHHFTRSPQDEDKELSRICVSFPHEEFKEFFKTF